jgi:trimeric autotransporter adhesin
MLLRSALSTLFFLFVFNGYSQTLPEYLPQDGLVGWWPFTGNANDSSGNGNNGVVSNAVLTADRFGNVNAAYNFNGTNSRIDIADAAVLRCRKITLSVWVFNNNIVKTSQVLYKGSLMADGEAYGIGYSSGISSKPNGALKLNSGCISGTGWYGLHFKSDGVNQAWEHLVMTYDGSTVAYYKNGSLDTSLALTGLIDSCSGGGLRIGFNHLRYNVSTGDGFDGVIDDVGIWSRALTANEISNIYTNSFGCGYGKMGINVCEPKRNLHIKDVLRLEPRDTPPGNPEKGDIYFDGTINKLRVFDGTVWQNCW